MSILIKGYELVNDDKYRLSALGDDHNKGVGEENEDAILAEYDKRGGLIKKDGFVVKTGSFFDLKLKVPRETPEVIIVHKIDRTVELSEEEIPEKQLAKILAKEKEVEKTEKRKYVKRK